MLHLLGRLLANSVIQALYIYYINSTECVITHQSHNANKHYYSRSVMEKQATIESRYLTDENNKPKYFSISTGSTQSENQVCDDIRIFNDVTVKEGGEFYKFTHTCSNVVMIYFITAWMHGLLVLQFLYTEIRNATP